MLRRTEPIRALQDLHCTPVIMHARPIVNCPRLPEIVQMRIPQFPEDRLHRSWRHQREPCVHTVVVEVAGKGTEEKTAECAAVSRSGRVPLAVLEAPCGHIEGGVVGGKEPVTASEGNGVTQDRTTDCVG